MSCTQCFFVESLVTRKKSGLVYSTIGSGMASQATPQGRRHKRAEVGFELALKLLPAQFLDHWATISLYY